MSKITEYEVASAFDAEDVLLKDGENGTMIISVENAASEFKRLGGINDDISGINQSVTQAMGTISSNIAGVETDYIASKDYAIGDLFIINNVLYKATAAIAEEDVIDTEINCAVVNLGDEIGDIRSELANKANVDGSYSTLTAGNAEQLVGTVFTEDDAAYTFRTAGGSADIGDREYDEIVGGSIVWNQLYQILNASYTDKGLTAVASEDKSTFTINGTTTTTGGAFGMAVKNVKDHVYYYHGHLSDATNMYFSAQTFGSDVDNNGQIVKSTSEKANWYYVFTIKNDVAVGTVIENVTARPQLFDLTQMFGSEIADYIYNLEQTTPGAGVAWFRKYFPKDYYEYNAGELMHVSDLQSHDMVGFNAVNVDREEGTLTGYYPETDRPEILDFTKYFVGLSYNNYYESARISAHSINVSDNAITFTTGYTGYGIAFPVRVLPDTEYFVKFTVISGSPAVAFGWYDRNGRFLGYAAAGTSRKVKTHKEAYLATVIVCSSNGSSVNTHSVKDLTFNLSWDGERDGEYEPYVKHSYPLDSSLTLRGIPKLSTDGKLYYDGDHYKSDGTVERRYGIVDLGTLEWNRIANPFPSLSETYLFVNIGRTIDGIAIADYSEKRITPLYKNVISYIHFNDDKSIGYIYEKQIAIRDDSYTDAASFKAAMSGVYLVYELAEPTTEEAQPFQSPQIVDDFGTEEYVTSSIVPVGHTTQYDHNLRAKLEMAPNSPDGDGAYLVRQTGSKNEYVPYTDGGRITALESKIPAAPSANGSYILKCTVTDGTATYAWVAE